MRWLAIFCFSAAFSIFGQQYAPGWALVLSCGFCILAVIAGFFQKRVKRTAALVLAAGIAFGSCYQLFYDLIWLQPARNFVGLERTVELTICSYPEEHRFGAKCVALMDTEGPFPVKVRLHAKKDLMDCVPGDHVTAAVELESAETIRGERSTSFTSKGIHLFAYSREELSVKPAEGLSLRYTPIYFNHILQEKIAEIYEGEPKILMTALLTGNRTAFDDRMYSLLSETGVTHVTAVSGMHCAFLFGMIRLLIRNRRRATLVSLPVLLFFMLMVGAAPSVMRACFMLCMLSIGPLFHRENDSITTMSFALFLILLQNPCAAASIGLQLSFLSVAGILAFGEKFYQAMEKWMIRDRKKRHPILRFLISAISTTCAASILTIPVVAYYFGCISLISPLTNLLCLSAIEFAFCFGMLSAAIGFLSVPIAQIFAIFPAAALDYFMAVVRLFSKIPYHAVYTNNPYLPYWVIYVYCMIAVLLISKRRPQTIAMAAGLSAATLFLVVSLPVITAERANLTAKVLNVGQGEAVLFVSGKDTALMDCGSSNNWIDAGAVAADELNTMGHTQLDYLILSHYHNDHLNGVKTLFSRVDVGMLIAPKPVEPESAALQQSLVSLAQENGAEVLLVEEGQKMSLGNADLHIYPPMGSGAANEIGLTLLCSAADFDMLVTGDMSIETEEKLLSAVEFPDIEVLVGGHHGSKYATGEKILEETRPEAVIIPVGANSYGHPAKETLFRLEEADIDVKRTDLNGTVCVTVN